MSVVLLAEFRRPPGGDAALQTFFDRYESEHLPLIAAVPGLRSMSIHRVVHRYAGDEDLVLVNEMAFDDREALDAAMSSQPMREAGRTLREIASGLLTLTVLEPWSAGSSAPTDPEAA